PALRVAPLAVLIHGETVAVAVAGEIERLESAGDRGLSIAGLLRQQHRADRETGRHRADAGVDHAVAYRRHDPPRDNFDPLGVAILQHDAELVRGEAADAVPAAQRAADAPAGNGDDLVADVVAIGF